MIARETGGLAATVAGGLLLFALLIGLSQGLVAVNARLSPQTPWFPVPALAIVAFVIWLVNRRLNIRLAIPAGVPWGRAYGFALLATLGAMCLSVLEAAYHGLVREAPSWPAEVSPAFQLAFLLTLPLIASAMAEVAFRGLIQTALERILPLWPMLLLIAVLNALMHFYDPDQMSQWIRFLSLNIVWGYATWRTQSILPALAAHVLMNVIEPGTEYLWGPTDMGALSTATLGLVAATGLIALVAAVFLARGWPERERYPPGARSAAA